VYAALEVSHGFDTQQKKKTKQKRKDKKTGNENKPISSPQEPAHTIQSCGRLESAQLLPITAR
jgi:hypothetical protein